ncbi:hypothetical protein LLE87_29670, partial [Paenibacillus polymyxa]|nr:hypothetical protein [Paenibacillus polymyxa]
ADVRSVLRAQKIPVAGVERSGMGIAATFANSDDRDRSISTLRSRLPDLEFTAREENGKQLLMAALNPAAVTRVQDSALKQNINTLHNRINELGVAEPVIQQQGSD